MMNEIFKNVDEDKRERIINSSLEEFSRNGFNKASTNVIVKNAKISKGLLFHYFGNKLELYNKLIEFVIELMNESISNNINWDEKDFFLRIKEIVIIKTSMTNKYPYIYEFLKVVFEGKSVEEIQEVAGKHSADLTQKVYTYNIDFSLFRDEIDMEIAMNIIRWTFEKFGVEVWEKGKSEEALIDMRVVSEETDKYINTLRKAFYK